MTLLGELNSNFELVNNPPGCCDRGGRGRGWGRARAWGRGRGWGRGGSFMLRLISIDKIGRAPRALALPHIGVPSQRGNRRTDKCARREKKNAGE